MTPYQAVLYAAAIYAPVRPDVFKQVICIGDWTVGIATDAAGDTVIAIEGSRTLQDFIADADAWPVNAGQLGMVHAGFYREAPAVFAALRPYLVGRIAITGHSLGAGRAPILAALCANAGIAVAQLFMFEPPRPGYQQLADVVKAHVPMIFATRNARDFVPDLPSAFPFPYRHIVELNDLNHRADSADPVADHMLSAIIPAVLKMWPE